MIDWDLPEVKDERLNALSFPQLDNGLVHLQDMNFVSCQFIGPFVAAMSGMISLKSCNRESAGDLIEVAEGTAISGAIIFTDCSFLECEFSVVQFMSCSNFANAWRKHLATGQDVSTGRFATTALKLIINNDKPDAET